MRKRIVASLLAVLAVAPVGARELPVVVTLQSVLDMPEASAGISGRVRFYLAGSLTPVMGKTFGMDVTNNKTLKIGRTPEEACRRNVLTALFRLEAHARKLGADAVIDLVSYNARQTFSSTTEIQCLDGELMGSLMLKGTYAKTVGGGAADAEASSSAASDAR